MTTAQQILDQKDTKLISIAPEATVLEAANLMNEHHIGALVVLADGKLVGIFTERDILNRIVSAQRDPAATQVSEVMTTRVACAAPHTRRNEMRGVMRSKRIRHIPVVEKKVVIGIISIGDLNRARNEAQEETINYLQQFISVA